MQTDKEYVVGREISSLRCESIGEYSLPDYNGDVKKVLLVKTQVYPAGNFVGDESLDFSGTVGYEVVYIDGEDNLTHAEFSTDYEAAVRINAKNYVGSDVKTAVSSCNMRLVGPRKLSVKCSLDSEVRIGERKTHSIDGDAFMEYEPECMERAVKVFLPAFSSAEAGDFNEEIAVIDGAIADEIEVLACNLSPNVSVFERSEGAVTLKGAVKIDMLIKNGENLEKMSKEVPYSEEVPFDEANTFEDLEVRLETLGKKSVVLPHDDGVTVSVSFSAAPRVYGRKNASLDLIQDAYLKERGTENEYGEFGYTEHICTVGKETKVEARRDLSELDFLDVSEIMYADASVRIESSEFDGNMAKIAGEIRFSGIACQVFEDGERSYVPIKCSVPFEENVNIDCQIHGNMRIIPSSDARDVMIEIDGDELVCICELALNVSVISDRRQRCLEASFVTDEEYEKDEATLTVYYPDKNESLFEIAKKFHTSVANIAECNRLTETVFAASGSALGALGVGKLLIK